MKARRQGAFLFLGAILLVSLLSSAYYAVPVGAVSANPNAKDVIFYWHYSNTPVSVGAIQTHEVLNTTNRFDFPTQQLAKQNSFYKPSGLPSVTVDFFLYPNLAGPANINGSWQVFLWVNASALHPTVFNIEFREFALGSGTATWDSGSLNPIVTSAIGAYVNVPVEAYNLTTTTPLAHTFAQNSTIDVSVTINDGSAADARIWYDSPFYPAKVILPALDRGHPAKVWTEDSTGLVTSSFVPSSGLKVLVNTNATDPFGGYDINATALRSQTAMVTVGIVSPNGTVLVSGRRMTLLAGGITSLNNILQYNITLTGGLPGLYTVTVQSTDNSGNMEQLSFTFTLGRAYQLGAYIVDSSHSPLPGSVFTASIAGYQEFRSVAGPAGTVNGTLVSANYTLRITWEGMTVYLSTLSFSSDTSLTLVTAVYNPTLIIQDDTGASLSGAVASITSPNGTVLPPMVSAADGSISLTRVPGGGYGVLVLWKTVNVYDQTVQISSAGPYSLKSSVYKLTVFVKDNRGLPVQGAYVVLYNNYGVVYDFKATDSSGSSTLKVPVGTYTVEALYSTTYLLTPITTSVNQTGVNVNSSGSVTVTLSAYPPSWVSTSLFLFTILAIVAIAVTGAVVYVIAKKRLLSRLVGSRRSTQPASPRPT